MKVGVGTQNKSKIAAVTEAFSNYDEYKKAKIVSCNVDSGVSNQPIGLEETIRGAKNRARAVYEQLDVDFGIGLESGIFLVPYTKSDYMDTTACVIYDGKEFHLGLSSCFEYPKKMIERIFSEKKEITDLALDLGFAKERKFREEGGMIGILTRGVIDRKKYSAQAVHMAIIHLINKDYY